MTDSDLSRLRRQSRWLSRVAAVVAGGLAVLVLLPPVVVLWRAAPEQAASFGAALWLRWLLPLPYVVALLAIGQGFRAFARGDAAGLALGRACRRAGSALALGAALSAFGVPLIERLANDRWRGLMQYDPAYAAVGVVGLALVLLGGLLDRASQAEARVRTLEHELEEFV
jgi:hypothetical protein